MALPGQGCFDVYLPAGNAHVPSDQKVHWAQNPSQMRHSHLGEMSLCFKGPLCHLPLDLVCWTAWDTSKEMLSPPHPKKEAPGGVGGEALQGKDFEKHLSLGWGNFGGIRQDFRKWLVIIKKKKPWVCAKVLKLPGKCPWICPDQDWRGWCII